MGSIAYHSFMTVRLIKTNASDLDVARAAWVSTKGPEALEADSDRMAGLINSLMKNHHTSPFEHGSFTFFVECPLFVAREFMRHRTFSYNEESSRYKKLEPVFYVPYLNRPIVQTGKAMDYTLSQGDPEQSRLVRRSLREAGYIQYKSYTDMLDAGVAREVARMVLPVNIYTSFYATVNPLNLMRFLKLRTDQTAQFEIRHVAFQMGSFLQQTMPITYHAYVNHWLPESKDDQ